MRNKKLVVAASAAIICLGGLMATSAEAGSRFGPTGLGSNLHRRFVIKQSIKRSNRGETVSNRRIIWLSKPYSNGVIRTRSRWR